jgi:hypothetical protein
MRRAWLAVVLGCSVLAGGCAEIFGPPYDWNNPTGHAPTKAQKKACNAACDAGGGRSDRNDAMCHFACVSLGDPWYTEHLELGSGGAR